VSAQDRTAHAAALSRRYERIAAVRSATPNARTAARCAARMGQIIHGIGALGGTVARAYYGAPVCGSGGGR
jgi:hypothetical protein